MNQNVIPVKLLDTELRGVNLDSIALKEVLDDTLNLLVFLRHLG